MEKDKVAHASVGFGLMLAFLFLADLNPLAWILVVFALASPLLWEMLTRHAIDREGLRDSIATWTGMMIAYPVWWFL